jgi:hypothetical protein
LGLIAGVAFFFQAQRAEGLVLAGLGAVLLGLMLGTVFGLFDRDPPP